MNFYLQNIIHLWNPFSCCFQLKDIHICTFEMIYFMPKQYYLICLANLIMFLPLKIHTSVQDYVFIQKSLQFFSNKLYILWPEEYPHFFESTIFVYFTYAGCFDTFPKNNTRPSITKPGTWDIGDCI